MHSQSQPDILDHGAILSRRGDSRQSRINVAQINRHYNQPKGYSSSELGQTGEVNNKERKGTASSLMNRQVSNRIGNKLKSKKNS